MYSKTIFLILAIISSLPLTTWGAGGSCSIENGPPPELTEYLKKIDTAMREINSLSNACGGTFQKEKVESSEIQQDLIEFYDEVDLQWKLTDSFILDFEYNIKLAFDGNSRIPVIRQGTIIRDAEAKIQAAFEKAGTTCNLDTQRESLGGKSVRAYLKDTLIYNRKVEYYFKSVATGDISRPDGISESDPLFISIARNYSKDATSSCENEFDFENITEDIWDKFSDISGSISSSLDGWKKAIRLFQGEDRDTKSYRELQSRVLQAELVRQGLSQSQISRLLGVLTCNQNGTTKDSTIWERVRTRIDCSAPVVGSGFQYVSDQFGKSYAKTPPRTTDEYLAKRIQTSTTKSIAIDDVMTVWSDIEKTILSADEQETNDQILSDLVSMHTRLVETNKLLKKKIPDMQKNCMKAGPTEGGCSSF